MPILFAPPTPVSEPVIAAVRAVTGDDVGAGGSNYDGLANCRERGADVCATVFRKASEDRDVAARELTAALGQACGGAGGVTDAPTDIVRLRALVGSALGVHSCRVGTKLSVLQTGVYTHRSIEYRLAPGSGFHAMVAYWKHVKPLDEDLTTIAGWTPDALAARRADILARADQRCAAEHHAAIREGVETSVGLVIEARASVALVQPRVGPATWKPIGDLHPVVLGQPCELTASELAARDLGER